jgi:hypothetical protein
MHVASPPGTVALHALPENGFAFRPIHRPRMRSWPLPVSMVAGPISGPSEAHPKHRASLWSNHIPATPPPLASHPQQIRKGKRPSSADLWSAPASRSADPHRSPPSRVEGKSGNSPYPPERSALRAILSTVPRAKLRDCVYRLNPEMARMVVAEGSA